MKKNKLPTVVTLAIFTTLTIFAWIFFDVYRALKKTPIIDLEPKILEPVNPSLDQDALTKIEQGKYFEESTTYLVIPEVSTVAEETPQPTSELPLETTEEIQ